MPLVLETGAPGTLSTAMSDIARQSLPRHAGAPAVPHFSEMRPAVKSAAHARLASADFTLIAVAIDTQAISPRSPLQVPSAMYAYALSASIDQGARVAGLARRSLVATIENSPILDLGLLRAPLPRAKGWAAGSASASFPPGHVKIQARPKSADLRLGAADGAANALFVALERGARGDPRAGAHADMHLPKLWRGAKGDGVDGSGWTMLPMRRAAQTASTHQWLAGWLAD